MDWLKVFRNVTRQAAEVINAVTNSKLELSEREESVDMCKAIEDMRNDAIQEGIEKGIKEGIEKGIEKGKAEGKAEGREEGILDALIGLVKDGILTLADAAKRANMTVPEFESKTDLN